MRVCPECSLELPDGIPRCPDHDVELKVQTISQMVDQVLALPEGSKLMLLAPVVENRKGEHLQLLDGLRQQGFIRARIDGEVVELDDPPKLNPKQKHSIDLPQIPATGGRPHLRIVAIQFPNL